MAILLSGEQIASRIIETLKANRGQRKISLAIVQIGDNKVSEKYIGEKKKVAKELGIDFVLAHLPSDISQHEAERVVADLGRDKDISGIIVQLPLPSTLETQTILNLIPVEKDVDVLSFKVFESFQKGELDILPPTVEAIAILLDEFHIPLQGKYIVIVGKGKLVGLPLQAWFLKQGITPVMLDKSSQNPSELTRKADILISATGKQGLITGDMIKEGAVVIDAGTSVENGVAKGDVDFASVSKKAAYITPVPGGVGPLTVACLFHNLVKLSQ